MKILIIGLGSIGKKHVDGILNLIPKVQIYALRSSKTSQSYKNVKNIYHKSKIPSEIDFAIISNITSLHAETILDLIQYKFPIFIEKPVLSNLIDANLISKLIKESNIKTYVACNLRFHPSIVFIKDHLSGNKLRINEVNIYCGTYLPDWRPGRNFRDDYSANKTKGGGVHLDLIHEIDYCCLLFGFPNSSKSLKISKSHLNIDSIDSARYILEYPQFSASITLNYYRRDPKRQIEIVTSEETIVIDLVLNEVINVTNGKVLFKSNLTIVDTYTRQIDYFLNQLETGKEITNNFDYAIKVLKLASNEYTQK